MARLQRFTAWWGARVPSNLVYPSSVGSARASSSVRSRRPTHKSMCIAERHVRRNITLKPGNVSKNWDAMGRQEFAQWCVTCTCHCLHVDYWRSKTSEFLVSDIDISRGRPLLSCLLQEAFKFLLHRQNQSLIHPQLSGERETPEENTSMTFEILILLVEIFNHWVNEILA